MRLKTYGLLYLLYNSVCLTIFLLRFHFQCLHLSGEEEKSELLQQTFLLMGLSFFFLSFPSFYIRAKRKLQLFPSHRVGNRKVDGIEKKIGQLLLLYVARFYQYTNLVI